MAEDGMSIEFPNLAAFTAALEADTAAIKQPREPLNRAARALAQIAAAGAPRVTGRLAGAHRANPAAPAMARVSVDTDYAAVQHWGWPGHGIRRRLWLVAAWRRDSRPLDAMAAGLEAEFDKAASRT